jgi:hypothetical protein
MVLRFEARDVGVTPVCRAPLGKRKHIVREKITYKKDDGTGRARFKRGNGWMLE